MIRTLHLLSALLATAVWTSGYCQQPEKDYAQNFSAESAEAFLNLARQAEQGRLPDEREWQQLFATDGYRSLTDNWGNAPRFRRTLRKSFALVFDPAQAAARDSLFALPFDARKFDWSVSIPKNLAGTRDKLDSLEHFVRETDFADLFRRAETLCRRFLTPETQSLNPAFNRFYLLVQDPDSRTLNGNIYLDAYGIYCEGEEGLVNLIAHEMHHNFWGEVMQQRFEQTDDPLAVLILNLMMEGIADQINKTEPPLEKLGSYPQEIVTMYNAAYAMTPRVLSALDATVSAYVRGELTDEAYEKVAHAADGHMNGFYIANAIRRRFGLDRLIEVSTDPAAYFACYNEAVAQDKDEHTFSAEFLARTAEVFPRFTN